MSYYERVAFHILESFRVAFTWLNFLLWLSGSQIIEPHVRAHCGIIAPPQLLVAFGKTKKTQS